MRRAIVVLAIVLVMFAGSAWAWYRPNDPRSTEVIKLVEPNLYWSGMPYCVVLPPEMPTVIVPSSEPCPWQYKRVDLYEGGQRATYGSGVTGYVSRYRSSKRDPIIVLNEYLRQGWELQENYRGEDIVYLRKRVCE